MRYFVFLLVLLASLSLHSYPLTPRPIGSLCTPQDKDFKEYRYCEQIAYCQRNVSTALKAKIYEWYDIPVEERTNYTIDHIIPLSLGGNNSKANLWPEHKELLKLKGNLEYDLYLSLKRCVESQSNAVKTILDYKLNPNKP